MEGEKFETNEQYLRNFTPRPISISNQAGAYSQHGSHAFAGQLRERQEAFQVVVLQQRAQNTHLVDAEGEMRARQKTKSLSIQLRLTFRMTA